MVARIRGRAIGGVPLLALPEFCLSVEGTDAAWRHMVPRRAHPRAGRGPVVEVRAWFPGSGARLPLPDALRPTDVALEALSHILLGVSSCRGTARWLGPVHASAPAGTSRELYVPKSALHAGEYGTASAGIRQLLGQTATEAPLGSVTRPWSTMKGGGALRDVAPTASVATDPLPESSIWVSLCLARPVEAQLRAIRAVLGVDGESATMALAELGHAAATSAANLFLPMYADELKKEIRHRRLGLPLKRSPGLCDFRTAEAATQAPLVICPMCHAAAKCSCLACGICKDCAVQDRDYVCRFPAEPDAPRCYVGFTLNKAANPGPQRPRAQHLCSLCRGKHRKNGDDCPFTLRPIVDAHGVIRDGGFSALLASDTGVATQNFPLGTIRVWLLSLPHTPLVHDTLLFAVRDALLAMPAKLRKNAARIFVIENSHQPWFPLDPTSGFPKAHYVEIVAFMVKDVREAIRAASATDYAKPPASTFVMRVAGEALRLSAHATEHLAAENRVAAVVDGVRKLAAGYVDHGGLIKVAAISRNSPAPSS